MARNKVDVKVHDLPDRERVKIGFVVLVLVAPAEIGVASVSLVGLRDGGLNRAGKICCNEINGVQNKSTWIIAAVPLSNAADSPGPQSSANNTPG